MSDRKFKQVGTRPIRPDGFEKVTGRANFGADIYVADEIIPYCAGIKAMGE